MSFKPERVTLVVLALLLAGCFRSAGENIAPTPTPEQSIPQDSSPAASEEVTVDPNFIQRITPVAPGPDVTATFPALTVFAPTRIVPADQQAELTATLQAQATMGFITPRVPSGPITLESPSVTPSGGALTSTPSGLVTPTDLSAQSADGCTYVVQPNDTLYRIATRNNLTLAEMRAANPDLVGTDPVLQLGQTLNIPSCGQSQQAAPTQPAPDVANDSGILTPGGEVYTVASGDTLFNIAQRYGITVDELAAANSLTDPNRLDIGQQLNIPPH